MTAEGGCGFAKPDVSECPLVEVAKQMIRLLVEAAGQDVAFDGDHAPAPETEAVVVEAFFDMEQSILTFYITRVART